MREQHRRRVSDLKQKGLSIDRLSDLPDSVICHILSFLQTKFSARTSILARRWRYLWCYVLTLDFDYYHEPDIIMDRVLSLRKVERVNTFRICDGSKCSVSQMERWVTFAIMGHVQILELCFIDCNNMWGKMFPPCLFTSKTLVDLYLHSCGVISLAVPVYLPRLKKLCLYFVHYESDECLPHLLSGCPVLEDLVIECCDFFTCNISSPTIKRLTLDFGMDNDGHYYSHWYRLEINTPALCYFKLDDPLYDHIKSGPLTCLIEADINLRYHDKILQLCNDEEPVDIPYSKSVMELIGRLRNITSLKLNLSYRTEITESVFSTWTICFQNLRKLELTADCRFLSKFLESADNLEILIFSESRKEIEGWMEPQQVPTCLSHLKTIKLVDIVGKKHEFKIVSYFLKNAQVLEKMEIAYPRIHDYEKRKHINHKISLFQRGSKACEVSFPRNS